ncbi:hypothetical protein L202_07941 [Cryptococcus amylolentus CBS 6039]|uniref:Uncharacterized protein n=2 Tax=Cryptococcus amylolentus TaxID=104669 RepID=A0A1E3HCC0_9TREE|nr:hypothetical protein L202_07941 [Cryptococcus amylolentus CBS 6039]ODN73416.1 hypothetical protein L202_07941 [Cryptococcus amylolentus CBS 6039]
MTVRVQEKDFNEVIQKYSPAFFDFAENVVLKSAPIEYKASKLFVTLGAIGMFQFAIPIVHWPLEIIAKFLQFSFLFTCGAKELRRGFSKSSSVNLVKSLLITFVVVVSLQTIPSVLFDIHYHFGALWHFCLPVLLLSLPSPQEDDRTVAIFLCEVFLSSILNIITATMTGMLPEIDLQDDAQRVPALFAFSALAISLWLGLLRETTAYLLIWGSILLSTVKVISQDQVQKQQDPAGYYNQMTVWHNLLAIWLWGFLISTIQSLAIPGLVSIKDLILYHLPSYFLWATLFILAMMLTKKTEKSHVADTWYARWLRGSS